MGKAKQERQRLLFWAGTLDAGQHGAVPVGSQGQARASNAVSQLIMSPIREHSRKPDEVRDRIVELLGDLPRIELFAREAAPGWDCWGKEAPINGVFRYDD